jgi:hypothetical protein
MEKIKTGSIFEIAEVRRDPCAADHRTGCSAAPYAQNARMPW